MPEVLRPTNRCFQGEVKLRFERSKGGETTRID